MKIRVIKGDITRLEVDAIVNAANNSLLGGGGVDGAIHKVAGCDLFNECLKLNGCKTGEAKITKGYKLPAKYIIHTVGPIYIDGKHEEAKLLKLCYINSLKLATESDLKSIAFSCISTGVYGYPVKSSAKIAINAIFDYFLENGDKSSLEEIDIVCYEEKIYNTYSEMLAKIKQSKKES